MVYEGAGRPDGATNGADAGFQHQPGGPWATSSARCRWNWPAKEDRAALGLSIANGLWVQTNFPFLPAYLDGVASNYDANLQQVNFLADAGQITGQINQWVADKTAGMITNLFASPLQ